MPLTQGQQCCVDTLDRPLVVAAGAGSGKTFTLTKRIVNALETAYIDDISQVCAITFTNKAAAELKSRIKGELRACGLIDQALKVDEAWISTIHGMCARILRAHAIELGIDPAFEVAEGALVSSLLSQAVDSVLTEAQQLNVSPSVDALFEEYPARSRGGFGSSVEGMLTTLVEEASSSLDGAEAFVLPGGTLDVEVALDRALCILEDLIAAAQEAKESSARDEWLARTTAVVQAARTRLAAGPIDYREALALISPIKLAKTFGGKDYKAKVDEAKGVYGAAVMEIRLSGARMHLETLVWLAERALARYTELKRQEGVLDNNDLLVLASRAITENPSIARLYASKFKLVMVDEFQDTDQMQVDMIAQLAGEGASRLCTVGDAQQSIYRFRGADVSVYRRHLERVKSSGQGVVIELKDNFRSHADVLSLVDRVFRRSDMFGGEFMPLAPGREEGRVKAPYEPDRPRVIVQHTVRPYRGVASDYACRFAARRIACEFAKLARAGHSLNEMVVLLGRMSNADIYAQALRDEGMSCVIAGGSVFARSSEAQLVRQLVRLLANPLETEALFNVVTSSLFGLSAADILRIGGLGKLAAHLVSPDDGSADDQASSPRLECALRVLGSALHDVGSNPVSCIVEQILRESGHLSRLQDDGPEGLASAANLYKAIRMVEGVQRAGALGPLSVMRRFENALENSKEAPGALSVTGGDSVRIMTVHASKGLEFPIVAVADIKEDRPPSAKLLSASVGGRVYLSLDLARTLDVAGDQVDSATMALVRDYVLGLVGSEEELACEVASKSGALHRRLAIRELLALGDSEEAKRLLYVALTRAKEALIVSMMGKSLKSNPTGAPKSALSGVLAALDPDGEGFPEGESMRGFGGSRPAVVDVVMLQPSGEDAAEGLAAPEEEAHAFGVPCADDAKVLPRRVVYRPHRDGVFSYSSISEASHGSGVIGRLAEAHAVSADAPAGSGACAGTAELPRASQGVGASRGRQSRLLAAANDDGFDVSTAFDEDRATDLGTAFHRLAQYAVLSRSAGESLVCPPQDRIAALARSCKLDSVQHARLEAALQRWFASDIALSMAKLPQLDAEVPFFLSVQGAFLEGEIDLLGMDAEGTKAWVVDYKTGGSDGESADELRLKHVLQASCYAYAVMRQGVSQVEATFVRVERERDGASGEPQCVRYRFAEQDIPELESAIAEAHALACG